jgi:phenylpyruvate tautomerase PptA (4-oxalocrotonate tautomerase family)
MPVVSATLIEGYEEQVRLRLAERMTDAVAATLDAPLDAITVVFNEVSSASYMRGRSTRQPGKALPVAGEMIERFLGFMEERNLVEAKTHLADDFTMVFPGLSGGTSMTSLDDLVAFSASRYRWVKKHLDSIDEAYRGTTTTVIVTGTLYGEWPDGSTFENIRFIDRFEIEKGKIRRQQVWNDLAIAIAARA